MAELEPTGSASADVSSDVVDSGFDHLADERNDDALGLIDDALSVDTPDNVLDAEPAPDAKREQREGDGSGIPGGAPQPSPPVAQTTPPQALSRFEAIDFRMAEALGVPFSEMRAFDSVNEWRNYANEKVAARQYQQQQAAQQQRFQVQPFQMENPDQYDPQVVAMNQHWATQMAQMQQFYDRQFQAVNQQYGGLQQQVQKHLPTIEQYRHQQEQAIQQQRHDVFDRILDRIVDEEFVGRGSFSALSNPQHQQTRRAIARKFDALIREEREPGEAMPSVETLVEEAVSVVLRKQLAERERMQLTQKLKQRGRNTLAVPSQSLHTDDDAAGEEKALAEIDKFLRSR
jgi:hypothetical protein